MVTMYSPEDRTAKAIIRDTAVELFGRDGVDAVPLRGIAAQSGVSQALIIKHFGSRDGLIAAADEHVLGVAERLLHGVAAQSDLDPHAMGVSIARLLGGSPVAPYLAKLLTSDGERSRQAFDRLAEFARGLVDQLAEAGVVVPGVSRADLAAVLLVHDLSALLLRTRIVEAFGIDPIAGDGAERWARTTRSLYSGGALVVGG
jgi:AcrR family transcriptional regulator